MRLQTVITEMTITSLMADLPHLALVAQHCISCTALRIVIRTSSPTLSRRHSMPTFNANCPERVGQEHVSNKHRDTWSKISTMNS